MKTHCILLLLLWCPISFADEVDCLALNIYHEAKNQSVTGKYAVAETTMNRVRDKRWPSTVCGVVKQQRNGVCQFSWYCDGKSDKPKIHNVIEKEQWIISIQIAEAVLRYGQIAVTNGALWYHSVKVKPYWANVYRQTVQIEDHIFYKEN
tara:strand:+ start:300 stop:749 length:450 start_codon:yes stop_codon:yes gene_type:complete